MKNTELQLKKTTQNKNIRKKESMDIEVYLKREQSINFSVSAGEKKNGKKM